MFYVVERIQEFSLTRNTRPENGDILGQFFEGIVEQGFKQSRGQFFTHHNIVQFIIYALGIPQQAVELVEGEHRRPPRLPYVCDPSAGSGTFLIQAMKTVTSALRSVNRRSLAPRTQQALDSLMPTSKPHKWAEQYLYGVEINKDLALATKVNMVVHGDGSINVFAEDGLADFRKFESEQRVSVLAKARPYASNVYEKHVNESFDFIISIHRLASSRMLARPKRIEIASILVHQTSPKTCFWSAGFSCSGQAGASVSFCQRAYSIRQRRS